MTRSRLELTLFLNTPRWRIQTSQKSCALHGIYEGIALRCILAFWPGARPPQIVAKLMEVAHCGAVTRLEPELLLEKSMDFDSHPVKLASLARILQDWH